MITTIGTYKPNIFSPAYNPIIWSCYSSNVAQIDMKYVFDIYMDGYATKVLRIKQRPNPDGYGMIDVSTIMQGYLDWTDDVAEITNGETTIDYTIGKVFAESDKLCRHVLVKAGEEYRTQAGAELKIYTGVNTSVGDPAYVMYSGNTSDTTAWVHTWAATLSPQENLWNMQKVTASGVFGSNPFQLDGTTLKCYDHGVTTAYPLSFDTLTREVYSFDKSTLSFLNWSPYGNTENRPIYGFRFAFATPTRSYASIDVPMITANGYSQRSSATASCGIMIYPKHDIVHVLASFDDVMTALGVDYENTAGCSLTITGHKQVSANSATFGAAVTKSVKFTIKEYCDTNLYQRVRLSWLNSLGGRDYMNFNMMVEKSTKTKQDEFVRDQLDWSGITPVPLLNDSILTGKLGMVGGMRPYNKQAEVSYELESDWLTQDQVNMLEELIKSPQVLAYFHDPNSSLTDDFPQAVKVTDTSYSITNVRQKKMVQGEVKIELVNPQKMQVTY